jgi:hypothetical protein
LDLSESIFENIIKDFFFKFLILKYYGYNEKIFCYDISKIKIKIELPNSYIDYIDKYKILKYFRIGKKIIIQNTHDVALLKGETIMNIKNYKIQVVSNILKMYVNGKINEKNINLKFNDNNNKELEPINEMEEKEFDSIINKFLINNIKELKKKK